LPPMIVLEYIKRIPVGPVVAIGFVLIVFSMSRSVTATSFAPELVGLPSGAAQETATAEGFSARIETRPEGGVPGTVVSQDPVPGEALELGDTITIFVTEGADQKTIPDVTGMPVDQARQALRRAGVTPGDIVYRDEPDLEPDRVIHTDPPKGRTVDEGTIVEIVATAP
jgi:beta-lactam-binding protein with PASTA domain